MSFLNYDKETDTISFANNDKIIDTLAIVYDEDTGVLFKCGDKAEMKQLYQSMVHRGQMLYKLEHPTGANPSFISLENMPKESAYTVAEYFWTHTEPQKFLAFLKSDEIVQKEKIEQMKEHLFVDEAPLYTLYCGNLSFDVTREAKSALDGLMYWVHCERMEKADKFPNPRTLKDYSDSIKDMMNKCEKLHVPNWVGNGAIQFANDNDIRSHYMREFYEKSKYAKKENLNDKAKPKKKETLER